MAMKAEIRLYWWELESMGNYSLSLPTATTAFKMWRRCTDRHEGHPFNPGQWMVGQYLPSSDGKTVPIRWFRVVLRHGPRPQTYHAPDWSNRARWRRDREAEKLSREAG